jgi:hypothetical protein
LRTRKTTPIHPFLWSNVCAPFSVLVFLTVFVLLDLASPMMIPFGAVDVIAASWTLLALLGASA